ncbi:hypothetical protein DAMA08_032080 [Martiniozyma asiatica (nom. inval.)]|nr:hypothetical protein DAMA08_032080 [Martiniozyma asiatica]
MPSDEVIDKINKELQIMSSQMESLAQLTNETSLQFDYIKDLALSQASLFMGAHSVVQSINEEKEEKASSSTRG